jgi:imidazole glycerol-phosphate synthase subunit HisH
VISIVDYGVGNLASLANMFDYLDIDVKVVSDVDALLRSDKVLLPGVGSFDSAMRAILVRGGLAETLEELAFKRKVPILGVCLGMQLLMNGSEEGLLPGLGWISGTCKRIPASREVRVPHMGWNRVHKVANSPLLPKEMSEDRFYFVHSFYVELENAAYSLGKTEYAVNFDSIVQKDNLFGVQFHPEKSHRFGMKILSNFGRL